MQLTSASYFQKAGFVLPYLPWELDAVGRTGTFLEMILCFFTSSWEVERFWSGTHLGPSSCHSPPTCLCHMSHPTPPHLHKPNNFPQILPTYHTTTHHLPAACFPFLPLPFFPFYTHALPLLLPNTSAWELSGDGTISISMIQFSETSHHGGEDVLVLNKMDDWGSGWWWVGQTCFGGEEAQFTPTFYHHLLGEEDRSRQRRSEHVPQP